MGASVQAAAGGSDDKKAYAGLKSAPRLVPAGPSTPSASPVSPSVAALPVELAAFRGRLPEEVLASAAARARRIGVGGDQVLVAQGHVSPAEATRALADHLGLEVARPDEIPFPRTLDLARAVLRTGAIPEPPRTPNGRMGIILAVEGREVRRLARALKQDTTLAGRLRLLPPSDLRRGILGHAGDELTREAAFGILETAPLASAGALSRRRVAGVLAAVFGAPLLLVLLGPALLGVPVSQGVLVLQSLLSLVFLCWIALRLAGCFYDGGDLTRPAAAAAEGEGARQPDAEAAALPDDRDLPVYSVLVPLYREAAVVPHLVAALQALDFPPEKLDIKLVVEVDDSQTRAAIAQAALPPHMEEIAVPAIGPRTKPKALDLALAFTRGSYVCIYDAEDHPEPDQLRRALASFRSGPGVGCVQARLRADNGAESWISGQFAAEYAAQFDVLLPVLSALDLPILLGGTSNHFRRDVLESVGAWDPFNVTEDADLGIRLVRAGWRTRIIASTTFEEAPISWRAWLGQRTRWMKGWMQTLLVHGRSPRTLVRELGLRATLALMLLTIGPFASAFTHPLFLGLLVYDLSQGVIGLPHDTGLAVIASALSYATLLMGTLGAALAIGAGMHRRGQKLDWRIIGTIPFYWLLVTLATCNALMDLLRRPFYWAKTEHGLSRARQRQSAFGVGAGDAPSANMPRGSRLRNSASVRARRPPGSAWN